MTMPSIEQAKEALRDAEKEDAYWAEHFEDLLANYRDQLVAVKDGVVVAAAHDLFELVRALEEKQIDIGDTWVEYITDDYTKYLL